MKLHGFLVLLALGGACSRLQPRSGTAAEKAAPAAATTALDAAALDRLIEDSWRAAKVEAAPPATDGEFLRRVTLDLAGRVPTLDEARAFLVDERADKRARAVDALLGSRDFAEQWADRYGTLLFGELRQRVDKRQYDPRGWLVRAFEENWRYDRIAREVLTATGDLRDNGALAFLAARLRGGGGPEAVAGAAARIFLGLQIQCAQCHDHPYDARWKQEDFYGLVSYFARTRARQERVAPDLGMDVMSAAMPAPNARTLVVLDARRGEARMRRPGSETDVVVAPRFLGASLPVRPDESRREAFTRRLLTSDLFPKTMVARTWAQLFGRGLVDPWDDLRAEDDPSHPPLLRALAADFAAGGYDVKRLVRTLVLSTAYARSSAPPRTPADARAVEHFARAGIRPLLPEQLFGALLTATGVDDVIRRRGGEEALGKRLRQGLREYAVVFGDDEMTEVNTFDGSVPQALLLLNGELTNQGARATEGAVLGKILAASPDPARRLEDMFLAVYTRLPTEDERRELLGHLADRRGARAAYEDVFFALLTSTEAVTNH